MAALAQALAWLGASTALAAGQELDLGGAVRQALAASLDLVAQRAQLEADREEIGIARAGLLPQAAFGAQGQILDADRATPDRGNTTQKSATIFAGVSQVIYDDSVWADYSIQKHRFESQRSEFESFRLGLVAATGATFLALEQAEAVVDVQRRNRELTRQNVETARVRVSTGYSGERDVLRWESQLSSNDTAVARAEAAVLVNRFELNRVRDQPLEDPIEVVESGLAEYGFAYARPSVAKAIESEAGATALRNFMVRVGLSRSPDLAAVDAAVAAEKRSVTAGRRAFWVPTVTFGAGVDHLVAQETSTGGPSTSNDTEWGVKAGLSIPIFAGGARISELRQSSQTLSSLKTQRRSLQQTIEETIRGAFAQASAAFRSYGFAKQQQDSSQRNFQLVRDSYKAGVSSILDLLDAQTQLLEAELSVANAYYGFLTDVMVAEQAIALFGFLEPESEVIGLLDQLEAVLRTPR
jgi:outer membrane protein